jgi:hypothetical protein
MPTTLISKDEFELRYLMAQYFKKKGKYRKTDLKKLEAYKRCMI